MNSAKSSLTLSPRCAVIPTVSDASANHGPDPVCVALCIDAEAIDRLGPVLRHLVVGLVDQAIHVKLVGSDQRLQRLALGPVQTHIHPPLHWPTANRRIDAVIGALSSQPPTLIHAMSAPSYGIGQTLAEALDADTVLYVSSRRDCHGIRRLEPTQIGGVIVTSDVLVRVLADQLKVPSDRVHLVRPGVLAGQHTACFENEERETFANTGNTLTLTGVLSGPRCPPPSWLGPG